MTDADICCLLSCLVIYYKQNTLHTACPEEMVRCTKPKTVHAEVDKATFCMSPKISLTRIDL